MQNQAKEKAGLSAGFRRVLQVIVGGGDRIRTYVGRSPLVLQTSAFDRSATPPVVVFTALFANFQRAEKSSLTLF